MESYHAACLFRILKIPEANVLSVLSPVEYKKAKRRIVTLILNTDMAFHFDLIVSFHESQTSDDGILKDLVLSIVSPSLNPKTVKTAAHFAKN